MSSSGVAGGGGAIGPATDINARSITLHGGDVVVRDATDTADKHKLSAALDAAVTGMTVTGGLSTTAASTFNGTMVVNGDLRHAGTRVGLYAGGIGTPQAAAIASVGAPGAVYVQAEAQAAATAVNAILTALRNIKAIAT